MKITEGMVNPLISVKTLYGDNALEKHLQNIADRGGEAAIEKGEHTLHGIEYTVTSAIEKEAASRCQIIMEPFPFKLIHEDGTIEEKISPRSISDPWKEFREQRHQRNKRHQ